MERSEDMAASSSSSASLQHVAKQVYQHWFKGLGPSQAAPPPALMNRWWGFKRSAEERAEFDQSCSSQFLRPLKDISSSASIGTKSKSDVDAYASKLLAQCCSSEDPTQLYENSLGLILLLDQMPRCIFRDDEAKVVYSDFDPIAQAVSHEIQSKKIDEIQKRDLQAYRQWFYLPMVHSESLEDQKISMQFYDEMDHLSKGRNDEDLARYLRIGRGSAQQHYDIIKRFGRFPHRNDCLKRTPTKEEKTWLAQGGTNFS